MKDTLTYKNLCTAVAGESQAQQRYKMFAKVANKEGYNNISEVFLETAKNEYQHAKKYYELLIEVVGEENMPNEVMVDASYPLALGDTYANLIAAAKGESEEVIDYSAFAVIAKDEGFPKVAAIFDLVSKVENRHSERYSTLANLLNVDKLLKKEEETYWICDECGHVHYGTSAPSKCPICSHNQGHFTKYSMNY